MRTFVAAVPEPVPPPLPAMWRRASSLSPRQMELLWFRACGMTSDEVCHQMRIAKSTFWNTLGAAKRRLGVENEVEAFRILGWLKVPE